MDIESTESGSISDILDDNYGETKKNSNRKKNRVLLTGVKKRHPKTRITKKSLSRGKVFTFTGRSRDKKKTGIKVQDLSDSKNETRESPLPSCSNETGTQFYIFVE